MTEMTMTQAVEMLRELIPDEDAVQINDGAQMWDASALVDAVQERDDGEVHDLAVNDEGISRVRPDGTIESIRIYQVQPRPTVARLAADLRGLGGSGSRRRRSRSCSSRTRAMRATGIARCTWMFGLSERRG